MMSKHILKSIADQYGTPTVIIDHNMIRHQYRKFKQLLPRVQVFYAIKANAESSIIRTLMDLGSGFDIASLQEFQTVTAELKDLTQDEKRGFIQNKIIYANPVKPRQSLAEMAGYSPLVTFDNYDEIQKIRLHAPTARCLLRLRVPNESSAFDLSTKFGCDPDEASGLIKEARRLGLNIHGISFHVGSQCANFEGFRKALEISSNLFQKARSSGTELKLLDIGGGFPAAYMEGDTRFDEMAIRLGSELDRLFAPDITLMAEPGRFMVATAGTALTQVIGKSTRSGVPCYYLNDGLYQTFSCMIFDLKHYKFNSFKGGPLRPSQIFGQTCDSLDAFPSLQELPDLEIDELLYVENIGAYSTVSATSFNGFPPAKIVHLGAETAQLSKRRGLQAPLEVASLSIDAI